MNYTPGPWYVLDFRASEMKNLGWTGPTIDRILITNKNIKECEASSGHNCVIARIQMDNRPDFLGEKDIMNAKLIAASPAMFEVLRKTIIHIMDFGKVELGTDQSRAIIEVLKEAGWK